MSMEHTTTILIFCTVGKLSTKEKKKAKKTSGFLLATILLHEKANGKNKKTKNKNHKKKQLTVR
jgi:hypothetical protein